jgi:hypothetical protein
MQNLEQPNLLPKCKQQHVNQYDFCFDLAQMLRVVQVTQANVSVKL